MAKSSTSGATRTAAYGTGVTVGESPLNETQVTIPSGKHPKSHFKLHRTTIEQADNGGFTVTHHHQLKPKFEGMRHMEGGYKEPATHVFPNAKMMHKHLGEMYPAGGHSVNPGEQEEGIDSEGAGEMNT